MYSSLSVPHRGKALWHGESSVPAPREGLGLVLAPLSPPDCGIQVAEMVSDSLEPSYVAGEEIDAAAATNQTLATRPLSRKLRPSLSMKLPKMPSPCLLLVTPPLTPLPTPSCRTLLPSAVFSYPSACSTPSNLADEILSGHIYLSSSSSSSGPREQGLGLQHDLSLLAKNARPSTQAKGRRGAHLKRPGIPNCFTAAYSARDRPSRRLPGYLDDTAPAAEPGQSAPASDHGMLCSPNLSAPCMSSYQGNGHHQSRAVHNTSFGYPNASSGASPFPSSHTTMTTTASSQSRPRNHVRSVSTESPLKPALGHGVHHPMFEAPLLGRQQSTPEKARASTGAAPPAPSDAASLQHVQLAQAKRRPRIMRLTPAYQPASGSPSPPSSVSSSTKTTSEEGAQTPPEPVSDIPFPSSTGNSKVSHTTGGLHPASRKAMALKANSPGPEVINGLHLDLGCLPSPSTYDKHGAASTSTLPDLIRKKSGEPVKSSLKQFSSSSFFPSRSASDATHPASHSSSSRAKSVPSTPNIPKVVHFDQNLEQIKVFKVKQRPTAVSREGSPEMTETETEEERDIPLFGQRRFGSFSKGSGVSTPSPGPGTPPAEAEEQLVLRLPNFPSSAKLSVDRDIFLERVFLSDDLRSIKGTIQVRNLSFEKWVAVRFTLDHWATVSEVSADHSESIKDGNADRFVFTIKLNELLNWPRGAGIHETKTMFVCLRYTVNGREIWDNNEGKNYQLDFRKRQAVAARSEAPSPAIVETAASPAGSTASSTGSVRRHTTSGVAPPSRIVEMGRRTVVHGGRPKNDSVMEQLRRELDRLRSDEEEVERAPLSASYRTEMAKRRSPPVSPGGPTGPRSSSPSMWSARYDFGASLRNPTTGSRKTDAGRAAALDYFSSRPTPQVSSPPKASNFVLSSSASPAVSSSLSTPRATPSESSPNFQHRFGMLSPGLENGVVEHKPVTSATASPTVNTLAVPRSAPSGPSKFFSFPPNRNTPSPGASDWEEDEEEGVGGQIGRRREEGGIDVPASPLGHRGGEPATLKIKSDGLVVEDYTLDGSQASPCSLTGSPNPFSPALSSVSLESDTTVGMNPLDDKGLGDSIESFGSMGATTSSYSRSGIDVVGLSSPSVSSSYGSGSDSPENLYGGGSQGFRSPSTTISSGLQTPEGGHFRPATLTSFNELVARFCWNSDNQLPLGESAIAIPGPRSASPPNTSGRTTPTAKAANL